MIPRKENIQLKPEWLEVPPEPSNSIHLDGWHTIGNDQPDLLEHVPDLIRDDIRNKYSLLLKQHDALEIAYWSLEGFKVLPATDFRFQKYKNHTDQLYSEGTLRPDPDYSVLLKHACLCLQDDLPHVGKQRSNEIVDRMVFDWLEGRFRPDKRLLEKVIDKIFKIKSYLTQLGENSSREPASVMNAWVDRLYMITQHGSTNDLDWDDRLSL